MRLNAERLNSNSYIVTTDRLVSSAKKCKHQERVWDGRQDRGMIFFLFWDTHPKFSMLKNQSAAGQKLFFLS